MRRMFIAQNLSVHTITPLALGTRITLVACIGSAHVFCGAPCSCHSRLLSFDIAFDCGWSCAHFMCLALVASVQKSYDPAPCCHSRTPVGGSYVRWSFLQHCAEASRHTRQLLSANPGLWERDSLPAISFKRMIHSTAVHRFPNDASCWGETHVEKVVRM